MPQYQKQARLKTASCLRVAIILLDVPPFGCLSVLEPVLVFFMQYKYFFEARVMGHSHHRCVKTNTSSKINSCYAKHYIDLKP